MKEETLLTSEKQATIGIAHHRIRENTYNPRFNYEFIEVNKAFETIMGITSTTLVGRTLSEVLPRMINGTFDWMALYNEVAVNGGRRKAHFFSPDLEKWYTLNISSPAEGYLTTLIHENDNPDVNNPPHNVDNSTLLEPQLLEYRENILLRKKILKSYFDANPIATLVWKYQDNRFYLDEVNQTALDITGAKIRSFIGLSSRVIYDDVPFINEQVHECFHRNRVIEFELNYRMRFSGKHEWVKFKLVRMDPDKVLMFAETITRQKKTEQDLIIAKVKASNSASKYRALYLNAPLSFQSLDINGCILDVNPMWIKVLGYDCNEILGQPFTSFLHPSCVELFNSAFIEFKKTGFITGAEFKVKKKDDSYIDIIYEGNIGYSDTGEFQQTYCVFTDITALKTAQEALRHSEYLLNSSQHLSKSGGWEWNPLKQKMVWTRETFNIHEVDPDMKEGDVDYMGIMNICYTPHYRQAILEKFYNCIENGTAFDIESPFVSMKGQSKWIRVKGEAVMQDGQVIKVIGNIVDITERKHAEEERIQREKLIKEIAIANESLRFKQNFLANMSHEMRSPLTGILGMAEIMSHTPLNDLQKDYLNTIVHSGDNLRTIINNVLDFSKLEAGKMHLKKSVFPVRSITTHTGKFFKGICRKPISFECHLDANLPEYIHADVNRINQIIHNLVFNAVKFTDKGKISLAIQPVRRPDENNQMYIKIKIKDTGKGIDPAIQQKLFIPFSQIEDNDTRETEGTGLGLSICKELVKLHGGEIGMESELGKGSTFWFTFKTQVATPSAQKRLMKINPVQTASQSLRILLAEDKEVNQKVIKLLLNSQGHQVTLVKNGLEAIEVFDPALFDLVLMDIQMPVMDGIKATQIIRSRYKALPPIIGLSANAFEGDREKYMSRGLDEYLIKPLKTDDFNTIVREFFVERKSID